MNYNNNKKNSFKKIGICLSIVTLFFIPQLGFAASIWGSEIDITNDLSIYLLRQVFGNVGGGVESGVGTILGQLFGVFNAGLVGLTSLFLIYTITKSVLATAAEGEAMGKHLTSWVPLRVALGVGLLVPKATGYSLLNVIVMWVVVQGVIFGDVAWKSALDYLHNGGVLYVQPTKEGGGNQLINLDLISGDASPDVMKGKAGAAHIMKSSICMHALQHNAEQTAKEVKQDMVASNYKGYPNPNSTNALEIQNYKNFMAALTVPTITYLFDLDNHRLYFPGKVPDPLGIPQGVCGSYHWDWTGATDKDKAYYFPAKKTALQQIVDDIDPFVSHMVETVYAQPDGTDYKKFLGNYTSLAGGLLLDSAADYQSLIYPVRVQKVYDYNPPTREGGTEKQMEYYSDAVKYGWITAGRYYYRLMELAAPDTNRLDQENFQVQVYDTKPPGIALTTQSPNDTLMSLNALSSKLYNSNIVGMDNIKGIWQSLWTTGNDLRTILFHWVDDQPSGVTSTALVLAVDVNKNIIESSKVAGVANQGVGLTVPASATMAKDAIFVGAKSVVWTPLKDNLIAMSGVWNATLNDPNSPTYFDPPLIKMQKLGVNMVGYSIQFFQDVWSKLSDLIAGYYGAMLGLTAVLTGLGMYPAFLGGGGMPAQNAINGVIHMLDMTWKMFVEFPITMTLPLATAVVAPLFVTGAVLAFYVPLVPFMLFTFGVIAWMMFVIEAMAAAPLVALGITHPEGHDLLGKSEQALMLLVAVFVRPITMILGLMMAIILSHISLNILNIGYGFVVESVFIKSGVGPAEQADVYGLIRNCMVLVLYPFIALPIMNQCFSLIHIIPEKIMRWIGLHPEQGPEAQMLESVKGQISSQAEQLGRGGGEALGRAGRATGEFQARGPQIAGKGKKFEQWLGK